MEAVVHARDRSGGPDRGASPPTRRQLVPPIRPHAGDASPDDLVARVRVAERKLAQLESALESNRKIGIAVGMLMCRHGLTADQGIAFLRRISQERNVKVRELADEVIGSATRTATARCVCDRRHRSAP